MDEATLKQIRLDLERDRDDITQTLQGLGKRADDPLVEMLTASLADLRHALEKLEAGRYGRCESCSAAIAEQRLRALPAARLCQRCESELGDARA